MNALRRTIARVVGRRHIYDELAAEMQAHLDEKTDELIARGMSPAAARDTARRAFGNVTQLAERGRETWQWPTLESFVGDVRYAVRQLRRTPVVGVTIVLTLALGIGATATVFSWARSVLLNPLPGAADPASVYAIESTTSAGTWTPTSWLDYRDFQRYLKSFDGLAAAYPTVLAFGDASHAERRGAELVSSNFFEVLRVRPAIGRFFAASRDEAQGAEPTVVIGYDLWQSRYHGDSAVIGRIVDVNRFPFTIIGVAPPLFHGSMSGEQVDLWVPAAMLGQIVPTGSWWLRDRGTRTFRVLGRLAPGVSFGAARAEVETFAHRMAHANVDVSKGMGGALLPLWKSHWGIQDSLRAPLLVLLAACCLVLLVVCANAANLLLARATGRRRELALRFALGAPRQRLLRQLLTECAILAGAGAGLGLLAAVWLARSLRWLVPAFAAPALLEPRVDVHVLGFTLLLAGGVTVLAGVLPAIHGSRDALTGALAGGGRAAVGGAGSRARNALVVAEMTLAVLALAGAGLFYDSLRHERVVPAGFESDHVAMASVSITLAGYDSARGDAFLSSVADRLRGGPGVSAATYADYVPLSLGSGSWENLQVEGYAPQPAENMKVFRSAIGPDYFKTLNIPLTAGRDFTFGDDSAHAPVMIVNHAFVKRYFGGRSALGARVHGWGRWFTVVGVARDVKTYRLTDPPTPYFYVPARQVYRPEYGYTFFVRTNGSVDAASRMIADAVRAVDPTVPVYDAMSLAAYVGAPLQAERASAQLLALLSAVAVFLAAIGLYGVMAFAVAQGAKEIGVRMALGAQRIDVARTVAMRSGVLLGLGLIAGLAGAVVTARLVESMLFFVGAEDVAVFVFAAGAMTLIAGVATAVPAWRAMNMDPLAALRAD